MGLPSAQDADSPKDTRKRIIEAASAIIAESGFLGLTVSAVTQRAGIAKGSLYLHFDGKDELLRTVIEDVVRRLAVRLLEARAQAPTHRTADRAAIDTVLDFGTESTTFLRAFFDTEEREAVQIREESLLLLSAQRELVLSQAIAGTEHESLNTEVAARAQVAMIAGAIRWWIDNIDRVPREEVARTLAALFSAGIDSSN